LPTTETSGKEVALVFRKGCRKAAGRILAKADVALRATATGAAVPKPFMVISITG